MNEETKVIKKKPRGGNSPVIGNNGLQVEQGDNTKFLNLSIRLASLPSIDLRNEKQVAERINEYFTIHAEQDMKPTVAGLGIALGTSRQTLWAIKNNQPMGGMGNMPKNPKEVTDLIKKAYFIMENQWEQYMVNGKINPVTGIFLAKNNFGYQDKTEYVLTPNTQNEADYDTQAIRDRYLIDSTDNTEID